MNDIIQKTIEDFGDQWGRYTENDGYYGSSTYFSDIISPLLDPEDYRGRTVIEIGSGTGRITRMLLNAGATYIHAIEPAAGAFSVLQHNTVDLKSCITYLNCRGDSFSADIKADDAISIGVIHHIADPDSTIRALYGALKPGGRCFLWLYGKEGNESYLMFVEPLRKLTIRLPHPFLAGLCHLLNLLLSVYVLFCTFLPLPMYKYVRKVLAPMSMNKRYLIIYDQLNPAYAKYYTKSEAQDLLTRNGFINVETFHRHGYSWSVLGNKP